MKFISKHIAAFIGRVDWPLLLFIAGVTNFKIYIKLAALAAYGLYLLLRRLPLPKTPGRIGWFYLLMPAVGIISAYLNDSFQQPGYTMVAVWGATLWLAGGAAFYLLLAKVRTTDSEKLHATIKAFFIANLLASLIQLAGVMAESHSLVPYWYYDAAQVYGASTGDHIPGIFGGASVANSAVSALGAIWFLYRRSIGMTIACICSMMLCTSNLTLAFFLLIAVVMAVTVRKRRHRLITLSLIVFSAALYIALSPANIWYVKDTWKKFFGAEKEAIVNETGPDFHGHFYILQVPDSIYTTYRQQLQWLKRASVADTGRHGMALSNKAVATIMERWYQAPLTATPLAYWDKPGKLYTFFQTINFAKETPLHALAGAGMGNYSSRMAVKATGLGIEGRYPESKMYAGKDFMQGHLYTMLYYFSQPAEVHSVMNMPNSVYNQLLGEYGLTGVVLFVCFYLGFFAKYWRRLKGGRYLLLGTLLFFGCEYWFEMLSLTVIVEFLSLTDIFSTTDNERNAASARHGIDAGL